LTLCFRTFPPLKWAQRRDKVYITLEIIDVEKTEISLTDEGKLCFSAESHGQKYGFDMELFKGVIKAESGWNLKGRNVSFRLAKQEDDQEEYWPRLTKDKIKNQKITMDWSKWVDEDEVDEAPAVPEEEMQGFGGQGGMPGMGGAGGMDMASMQQMMAGMGGAGGAGGMDMAAMQQMMAGMGGMGGAGGMGPDSDDEDEDEQEAEGQPKTLADLDGEAE